jgi:hypothetical protein
MIVSMLKSNKSLIMINIIISLKVYKKLKKNTKTILKKHIKIAN